MNMKKEYTQKWYMLELALKIQIHKICRNWKSKKSIIQNNWIIIQTSFFWGGAKLRFRTYPYTFYILEIENWRQHHPGKVLCFSSQVNLKHLFGDRCSRQKIISKGHCPLGQDHFHILALLWTILNHLNNFERFWTTLNKGEHHCQTCLVPFEQCRMTECVSFEQFVANLMNIVHWTMPSSNWDTETQRWLHRHNIERRSLRLADRSETEAEKFLKII